MKLYAAAILAVAFLENFKIHIIRETVGSQTMAMSSCVDLQSTEINVKRIADYEEQVRPVKAVIFITKNGVKVCVPHDLPWVKKTMKRLKQRQKIKPKRSTPIPRAG